MTRVSQFVVMRLCICRATPWIIYAFEKDVNDGPSPPLQGNAQVLDAQLHQVPANLRVTCLECSAKPSSAVAFEVTRRRLLFVPCLVRYLDAYCSLSVPLGSMTKCSTAEPLFIINTVLIANVQISVQWRSVYCKSCWSQIDERTACLASQPFSDMSRLSDVARRRWKSPY